MTFFMSKSLFKGRSGSHAVRHGVHKAAGDTEKPLPFFITAAAASFTYSHLFFMVGEHQALPRRTSPFDRALNPPLPHFFKPRQHFHCKLVCQTSPLLSFSFDSVFFFSPCFLFFLEAWKRINKSRVFRLD